MDATRDAIIAVRELAVKTGQDIVGEIVEDIGREFDSLVTCTDERAEDVKDAGRNVKNLVGEQVDDVTGAVTCGLRHLLHPDEVDEEPTVEMRVRHPIIGQMMSLGCKLSITKEGYHMIHNIQSGSLAHKLNLKEHDVLFQIDEERVNMWSLAKVIRFLAEREAEFTLVIKRKKPNSDKYVYIAIKIKLSIEGDGIEAEVTGVTFIRPNNEYGSDVELGVTGYSFDAYVYQEVNNEATNFLNVQESTPYVTSIGNTTEDLYKFRVHQLLGWDRTVFLFHNVTTRKAIHAPESSGNAGLTEQSRDLVDGLQNSDSSDIIADNRMFYINTVSADYYEYESVIHEGSFLASENGRLVVVRSSGNYNTRFRTVHTNELDPQSDNSDSDNSGSDNSGSDNSETPKLTTSTKPNIIHKAK